MSSSVGVRELRQNLSKHLERVKRGETLTVTERGKEVAKLVPSVSERHLDANLLEKFPGTILPTRRLTDVIDGMAPKGGAPAGTTDAFLDESRRESF